MRVKVTLACQECKQRNYNSMKNKKNNPDRIELEKYCKFCKKHTTHKETKSVSKGCESMQTEAKGKFSLGKFFSEVRTELKKVHWPTKKEMLSHTTTVILTVVVMAVIIYGIDSVFGFIMSKILGN